MHMTATLRVLVVAPVVLVACKTSLSPSVRGKPIYPQTTLEKHGSLEVVEELTGPLATGVTVARDGRIFLNHPRWEEPVSATVVELRGGPGGALSIPRAQPAERPGTPALSPERGGGSGQSPLGGGHGQHGHVAGPRA